MLINSFKDFDIISVETGLTDTRGLEAFEILKQRFGGLGCKF